MKLSSLIYRQTLRKIYKNLLFLLVFIYTNSNLFWLSNCQVWAINPEPAEDTDTNVPNITSVNLDDNYLDLDRKINEDLNSINQGNINLFTELDLPSQNLNKQSQLPPESDIDRELNLKVRPRPVEGIPLIPEKPASSPIGFLRANVGYFHSSNIFSLQDNPIQDGLIFSGLTLSSAYLPVSNNTYINTSIDGNLIRYIDQSTYSYNQLRFNVGVYQQLSKQMYAELNLSNQQLFYAENSNFFSAGDRFLNENSARVSLGRRDNLTKKLVLDSLYEVSVNFSDPDSRSRIINSFAVGLNYYLDQPLQVGLNYQFNLSDFTERDREDQFHRLYGNLNYRLSKNSNVNLQSGVTFGDSTNSNLDFSSWFFTVNYGFELGRF